MDKDKEITGQWHLDKRVPLALIFAIMANIATTIWWAASLSSAVDQDRANIEMLRNEMLNQQKNGQHNTERIIRIEAAIESLTKTVEQEAMSIRDLRQMMTNIITTPDETRKRQ